MTVTRSAGGGIVLSHLSKSYGAVRAVREVDLAIAPGETVALLGPNGAGKTTTIDLVLGLTRPDSGQVSLFGMSPSEAVAAGVVGGMLQTGALLEYLSVRELVSMVASLYPRPLAVDDVLELTGARAFADRRTNKLSGGQTQRVRFAIALIANPDLLVLDEPTAAMDVEGRREFWKTMRAVASRGTTVVFATHYLEEADSFADRIIVMARGVVVADGSPSEISAAGGLRTIRATLLGADLAALGRLPGVRAVEHHGDTVLVSSDDSDATLRQFLISHPAARHIEVRGAGMEEAFLELTAESAGTIDDRDHDSVATTKETIDR
jgi:ABC-2 type transport system ATP-binding protein